MKCSKEEAEDIYEYDKKIDKAKDSERLEYDLTAEQRQVERKMARTGTRNVTTPPKKVKRDTSDITKEGIISQLYEFLVEIGLENLKIINKTRQIGFDIKDEHFTLTLTRNTKK